MSALLVLVTSSADATRALASSVAAACVPGDVLLLSGDLGAGKTTFAQGFGRALGIDEPVTSPTFTLVRQYEVAEGPGGLRVLLHADVYRLEHLAEVADLGLGQLVEDGGVALVEWGEAAEPVLGDGALRLRLEADPDDDDRRTVTVSADGPSWAARWPDLADALAPWGAGTGAPR
jgi:tRNA threonylcarbamoyladenosine biosynthesis protein TsaE